MGMKRANGTGCVTKLSGNRRNPWYAKAPITYDEETGKAHPPKLLSDNKGQKYFPSRTIPDLLLAEWNKEKGNIDINKTDYTFSQVYEEFSKKNFPTKEEMEYEKKYHEKAKGKLGRSVTNNLKAAYNKCEQLYNRMYKTLRKDDFEAIILNTVGCATVINSLANLFKKMDSYALENDIILKGYADLLKITDDLYLPIQNEGTPYSYQEIETIWQYEENLIADITLVTIYAGPRIEELLFTKTEDIYISDGYFIAGLKTASGKRRIIPIHHEILPIFCRYYNLHNEFLFTIGGEKIDYDRQFLPMYNEFMLSLNMSYHKSHDGRKTLHSEFDRIEGINELCVDRIFGHKSANFGKEKYSKKAIEELKATIEKIDYRSKKNTKITYLRVSG